MGKCYVGMDYLLIDSILTFGTKRGSGKFFMKVLSIHRKGEKNTIKIEKYGVKIDC